MATDRPKSPGWYRDPDILPGSRRTLRYWNGRHWTDRHRPAPTLANLDLSGPIGLPELRALEGPARTVDLPALAAEVSATRDGPGVLPQKVDRPGVAEVRGIELPTSAGGGQGIPPRTPETGGGGGGGGGGGDGRNPEAPVRTRKRRKWFLLSGLAVVCTLAVILIGESMRPPSPGPRVLSDARFIQLASEACAQTMPTLRPPDGGPFGSAVSPAQVATQIDKAAAGLDDLANRLAALPAAAADEPHIAAWLDGWHRYDVFGHQYADELRREAATGKAPPVLKDAANLAKSIDNFSRANGLNACEFAYAYVADPSQF